MEVLLIQMPLITIDQPINLSNKYNKLFLYFVSFEFFFKTESDIKENIQENSLSKFGSNYTIKKSKEKGLQPKRA